LTTEGEREGREEKRTKKKRFTWSSRERRGGQARSQFRRGESDLKKKEEGRRGAMKKTQRSLRQWARLSKGGQQKKSNEMKPKGEGSIEGDGRVDHFKRVARTEPKAWTFQGVVQKMIENRARSSRLKGGIQRAPVRS